MTTEAPANIDLSALNGAAPIPIPRNERSVAAGFLRVWATILAGVATVFGVMHPIALVLAAPLLALCVYMWLFFGRLSRERYSPAARQIARDNIARIADAYPDLPLAFENHDGASLDPDVCADLLRAIDRPSVGMNFDPINFARHGVDIQSALATNTCGWQAFSK